MGFLSGLLDVASRIAVCLAENGQRNLRQYERSHGRELSSGQRDLLCRKKAKMDSLKAKADEWAKSRKQSK